MAEVNVQYINPFLIASSSIIKEACQIQSKIGKPHLRSAEFAKDSVVIIIGLTGEMRGQIFFGMDKKTACHIASCMMMGMPVETLDDMACSAISELGNMIMGNAATILFNQGVGVDITPPTLCMGNLTFSTPNTQNISIPLELEGGYRIDMDVAIKE